MILWVYGKNELAIRDKVNFFKKHFFKKHDPQELNFELFAVRNIDDLQKSYEYFSVQPFLATMRMIVLEDVLSCVFDEADLDDLHQRLSSLSEDTLVVMTGIMSEGDLKRRKVFKKLNDLTHKPHSVFDQSIDFSDLIVKKLGIEGIVLNTAQKKLLQGVSNEIQANNIILQIKGLADKGKIKDEDFYTLCSISVEDDIFGTIDALQAGSMVKASGDLHRARLAGVNDAVIFNMLAMQVATSIAVLEAVNDGIKGGDLAKKTGVHPFVARKLSVSKLGLVKLREIFDFILESEARIKRGDLEYSQAIESCLLYLNT